MRTIFRKRQEYYKAIAAQKELAEELKFKARTASEAIKETLMAAMKSEVASVEIPVETDTHVEEKKKPGRKKA